MLNVLPDAPIRHWVLTLPTQLRFNLGYHQTLLSGVQQCFLEAIFHHLKWKAKSVLGLPSVTRIYPGAVAVPHRVSANLGANFHFHGMVIDGVYVKDAPGGPARFCAIPAPTPEEIASVAWLTCRRVRDLLRRKGYWKDDDGVPPPETVRGTLSFGSARPVRFFGAAVGTDDPQPEPRKGGHPFNVFARDSIEKGDRAGLKNLVLYLLSPPFTENQITIKSDGRVQLRLKRPRWDGTSEIWFSPYEFLEALTHLVPHPRSHGIGYYGVLGRSSPLRNVVVPKRNLRAIPRQTPRNQEIESTSHREARMALYVRVHRDDFQRCPRCLGKLQIVALVTKKIRYSNPHWTKPDTPQNPAGEPRQNETSRAA
jgi:hypothetical protein